MFSLLALSLTVAEGPSCSLILLSLIFSRMVFTLKNTTTAFFKRYQSEKCWNSFVMVDAGDRSVIVVTLQAFTCLLISGSSLEISPSDDGCVGQSFSGCHRNLGPLCQRCCSISALASNPRDASSAGFSFYLRISSDLDLKGYGSSVLD